MIIKEIKQNCVTKGSATLVLSILMCGVISFCGYSLARLTQVTNNSIESSMSAIQAQQYAESEMNLISASSYSALSGYERKAVGTTGLQVEALLGNEETYADTKKRLVTVKVYEGDSSTPVATLARTVFKKNPALYVEKGSNEDKSMTQKAVSDLYDNIPENFNDVFEKLSGGIEIPPNSDLNDYTEPGNYYCDKYVNSSTILNVPDVNHIMADGLHSFRLSVHLMQESDRSTLVQELKHSLGDKYVRYKLNTDVWEPWRAVLDHSNGYALVGGTYIPPNSDLNDYKDIGNYYCCITDEALTVKNTPIEGGTGAFSMQIRSGVGKFSDNRYRIQELTTVDGKKWFRHWYNDGSGHQWFPWQKVLTDKNFVNDYIVNSDPGYIKFPNGLVFAWRRIDGSYSSCYDTAKKLWIVTGSKPIAFKTMHAYITTFDFSNTYWEDYYWYWNRNLTTDTTDTFINYWRGGNVNSGVHGSVFWIGQAVE